MKFSPTNQTALQLATMLLIALFFASPSLVNAQTIDVGPPDTSVCNGTPIDLIAITSGSSGGGSSAELELDFDDTHSQIVDIGFPFEYFGNVYNQCVASSNGYITFDLGTAGTGSPWNIGAASPTPGVPDNALCSLGKTPILVRVQEAPMQPIAVMVFLLSISPI